MRITRTGWARCWHCKSWMLSVCYDVFVRISAPQAGRGVPGVYIWTRPYMRQSPGEILTSAAAALCYILIQRARRQRESECISIICQYTRREMYSMLRIRSCIHCDEMKFSSLSIWCSVCATALCLKGTAGRVLSAREHTGDRRHALFHASEPMCCAQQKTLCAALSFHICAHCSCGESKWSESRPISIQGVNWFWDELLGLSNLDDWLHFRAGN